MAAQSPSAFAPVKALVEAWEKGLDDVIATYEQWARGSGGAVDVTPWRQVWDEPLITLSLLSRLVSLVNEQGEGDKGFIPNLSPKGYIRRSPRTFRPLLISGDDIIQPFLPRLY